MDPVERLSDNGLAIFLFHGVVGPTCHAVRNYTGKHLERDRFYNMMQTLRDSGQPLSMDEVIEHCQADKPFPPRAFAVTFDDGFENNFSLAAPILREFSVPATFYVTTSFVDENAMSWIDRCEYCLERVSSGTLRLPWDDRVYSLDSGQDKIRVLQRIREEAKPDRELDLNGLVRGVFEQCGVPEVHESTDVLDQKMNWKQVACLAGDPLFTIGGHSHRHPVLSFLSADELESEIATSLDLIARKAGLCVRHYSYPEGLEYCYSNEVIRVLREHGILCCPTAVDGINDQHSDLFRLRRIMVA